MKSAENQKQPISVKHLQHEFNVTNEMDQELQHSLISRTEGEALESFRGAAREPGLEQWRRLAALYDPFAAGRSLGDSRQILSPPKASAESCQNRRPLTHHPSLGTSCLKTCDWLFCSPCAPQTLKKLTAQQHWLPNYAETKAHIVAVVNSGTRSLAPMMIGNLSDEDSHLCASSDELVESEDGELYRLEVWNGQESLNYIAPRTKQRQTRREGQNRQRMFSLWTHWSHKRRLQCQNSHQWRTPKICAQREKCRKLRGRRNRDFPKCAVGTIDLGSFEVLSDHGDEVDGDEIHI